MSDACPQHCGVLLVVTSLDVRVVSKQDLGGGRSVLRRGGRAHVRGTLGVHVIGWAPPGKPRCAERCYHDASERRRQRQRLGRVATGVKVRKGLLTVSVRRWRPAPRSASRTSVCPCLVAWCTPLHWFESNEPERAGSPARAACTPDRSPDAHFAWKASMSARTTLAYRTSCPFCKWPSTGHGLVTGRRPLMGRGLVRESPWGARAWHWRRLPQRFCHEGNKIWLEGPPGDMP